MPGVISAMAQAAGFGTGEDASAKLFKAMEDGTVRSVDVLEEFARILEERAKAGGALEKAMKTTAAEQARFNNAVSDMVEMMATAGSDSGFAKMFSSMSKFLQDNPKLIAAIGVSINKLGDAFVHAGEGLTNLVKGFDMLGDSLGVGGTNLGLFSVGALALATHFGRIAAAAGVLLIVLEDISVGMQGGDSYTKDFLDFLNGESFGAGAVKATALTIAVGTVAASFWKVYTAIKAAMGAFIALSTTVVASPIAGLLVKAGILAAPAAAAAAPVMATAGVVAAPLLAATALVPNANLRTETMRNQMVSRFGANPSQLNNLPLPGIGAPFSPYKSIADGVVKGAISKPAVSIGEVSVTFNGTPDQMMGSNEFSAWFTAELTKAAIESVGDN